MDFLEKGESKLGPFDGLFTRAALKKGDFLGFYCGRVVRDKYDEYDDTTYAMTIFKGVSIIADPAKHKLALINEPPVGKTANVYIEAYVSDTDLGRLQAIALYAARDVRKAEELYLHYGPAYESIREAKNYEVGTAARRPKKLQDPRAVLKVMPYQCFAALNSTTVRGKRPRGAPKIGMVSNGEKYVFPGEALFLLPPYSTEDLPPYSTQDRQTARKGTSRQFARKSVRHFARKSAPRVREFARKSTAPQPFQRVQ